MAARLTLKHKNLRFGGITALAAIGLLGVAGQFLRLQRPTGVR